MIKRKNWNGDKTQFMTKLKLCGEKTQNSKCDKTQIVTISRIQIMIKTQTQKLKLHQKLKLWWNSNFDEIHKLKLWEKKLKKLIVTKLNNSNCDKTKIVTKLKLWQNSNCDKTQNVKKKPSKTQNVLDWLA